MTVSGGKLTRILIDRTCICHAILYHFQITLFCGRINRKSIPLTLFLLSYPLEQLEFIRFSNLRAEKCFIFPVIRPQRFILPHKLQSRYRRHIFNFKRLFQLPLARRSLHQRSRFTVFTSYKNLRSVGFNLGSTCLKQISSLFTIKSHKF